MSVLSELKTELCRRMAAYAGMEGFAVTEEFPPQRVKLPLEQGILAVGFEEISLAAGGKASQSAFSLRLRLDFYAPPDREALCHQAFEAVCAGWLEESGLGPQQIQCGRIAYQPDLGCLHLPASASCTLAFGPEEETGDTIRDLIIRSEIL